jgi:hypothetical protein
MWTPDGDTLGNAPITISGGNVGIGTTTPAASAKLTVMGNQTFGLPGNGTNTSGRFISIEGNTDSNGEGSSRIFFSEHNSTTAAMDNYGMSLGYRGGATSIVGASGNTWTGLTQISNGQWGMWGHNNNAAGSLVMFGDRAATYVSIPGNVGIGTSNIGTQSNLYLGAASSTEGGQITLQKATGGTLAAHIDAYTSGSIDYMRVLSGTDTATTGAPFVFNLTNTRLGIGTTSPSYPLEIANDATTSFAYQRTGVSANKWGFHSDNDATYWQNLTTGNLLFTLQNGGNVGIGTTSPVQKLHVHNSTASSASYAKFSNAQTGTTTADGFDIGVNTSDQAIVWQRENTNLLFGTNNTERMRINSSGNVMINKTTDDGFKFSVNGAIAGTNVYATGTGSSFVFGSSVSEGEYIQHPNATNDIAFITNASESMRITGAGALLVNRTSSLYLGVHTIQADISGGGTSVLTVYNQNLSDSSPAINAAKNSATTSSTARFIQFYANSGAIPMGGIVGNGASNVQFAALSDIREKENIKTIESSLDKIDKLNPVEFDWKKSGEHIDAGFIAQEVENIFPEYVVENISNEGEEERKGLTGGMTSGIVAHLVKAIQELKAEVDKLKTQINK